MGLKDMKFEFDGLQLLNFMRKYANERSDDLGLATYQDLSKMMLSCTNAEYLERYKHVLREAQIRAKYSSLSSLKNFIEGQRQ